MNDFISVLVSIQREQEVSVVNESIIEIKKLKGDIFRNHKK